MKRAHLIFSAAFLFFLSGQASAQIKQFKGNWVKLGTTYDFAFDLYIRNTGGNTVEGVFNWQAVNFDEYDDDSQSYYEEKLGLWAKEFVRGTYDPKTRTYQLEGYKKEDAHLIIGLDYYEIKVDENGDINGKTRSFGTWKGRIHGKAIRGDSA